MAKRPALIVVLAGALAVAGCAGRTVLMQNPKGELAKCEVSTTGAVMGGVIARDMAIDNCVDQYEAAGYRKVKPD